MNMQKLFIDKTPKFTVLNSKVRNYENYEKKEFDLVQDNDGLN